MREIRNKTALITGAAGGIGRQIALELARNGAHIVAIDKDNAGLERLSREIELLNVRATVFRCDVADRPAVSRVTNSVKDDLGGVDILVNNAGITFHGRTDWMTDEHWDRILAVNLHAAIQFTRELLPSLLARREAHVLNVCSVLGIIGLPRVCAYSTSKFALVGFTEALRAEYGQQGIGFTAVCPGLVNTRLFVDAPRPANLPRTKQPPQWLCTSPERVARAAVRAIRKDRREVLIDPLGRAMVFLKRNMPTFLDWALHWGRERQTKRRLAEFGRSHTDSPNVEQRAA